MVTGNVMTCTWEMSGLAVGWDTDDSEGFMSFFSLLGRMNKQSLETGHDIFLSTPFQFAVNNPSLISF